MRKKLVIKNICCYDCINFKRIRNTITGRCNTKLPFWVLERTKVTKQPGGIVSKYEDATNCECFERKVKK